MSLELELQLALEQKDQASKQLQSILKRIAKGESTGDKLKDFLLVWQGGSYPVETEKKYRSLLRELDSHHGEPILANYSTERMTEPAGCFGGPHYQKIIGYQQLGIISERPEFVFSREEGGLLNIPGKNHLKKGLSMYDDRGIYDYSWKKEKKPLQIPVIYIPDLANCSGLNSRGISSQTNAELIIGSELVEGFFILGSRAFDYFRGRERQIGRNNSSKRGIKKLRKELRESINDHQQRGIKGQDYLKLLESLKN